MLDVEADTPIAFYYVKTDNRDLPSRGRFTVGPSRRGVRLRQDLVAQFSPFIAVEPPGRYFVSGLPPTVMPSSP